MRFARRVDRPAMMQYGSKGETDRHRRCIHAAKGAINGTIGGRLSGRSGLKMEESGESQGRKVQQHNSDRGRDRR